MQCNWSFIDLRNHTSLDSYNATYTNNSYTITEFIEYCNAPDYKYVKYENTTLNVTCELIYENATAMLSINYLNGTQAYVASDSDKLVDRCIRG